MSPSEMIFQMFGRRAPSPIDQVVRVLEENISCSSQFFVLNSTKRVRGGRGANPGYNSGRQAACNLVPRFFSFTSSKVERPENYSGPKPFSGLFSGAFPGFREVFLKAPDPLLIFPRCGANSSTSLNFWRARVCFENLSIQHPTSVRCLFR